MSEKTRDRELTRTGGAERRFQRLPLSRIPLRFLGLTHESYTADQSLTAEILVFWIAILAIGYLSAALFILRTYSATSAIEYTGIPLAGLTMSYVQLLRRRILSAAYVFCYGLLAGLLVSTYQAGGLMAPGVYVFIVPLVIASMTLGRVASLGAYSIVAAYILLLTYLELTGHSPTRTIEQPPISRTIILLAITGGVSSMIGWSVRRFQEGRTRLEREIATRREAEKQVRTLNAELEERVRERTSDLDAFTAMVAHDLRNPVLNLAGFANLLKEQEDRLDEEGRFILSRISTSTRSMNDLISNMLAFSRHQRAALDCNPVDMTELVQTLRYQLIEAGHIDPRWIQVSPMPPANSDIPLIRQIWVNLLDNAVKYSKHREQPEIRVYSELRDGDTWYVVEDNGLGFEAQDGARIFGEFERAHSDSLIPGSGIGLSTVKRIVERHGGKVMAEGRPNVGARVMFSLPRLDSDHKQSAEPMHA